MANGIRSRGLHEHLERLFFRGQCQRQHACTRPVFCRMVQQRRQHHCKDDGHAEGQTVQVVHAIPRNVTRLKIWCCTCHTSASVHRAERVAQRRHQRQQEQAVRLGDDHSGHFLPYGGIGPRGAAELDRTLAGASGGSGGADGFGGLLSRLLPEGLPVLLGQLGTYGGFLLPNMCGACVWGQTHWVVFFSEVLEFSLGRRFCLKKNLITPSHSTGGGRIVCFFGTKPAHDAVLVACISHYTNLTLNNHGVVCGVNAPHKQEQPGEQKRVHKHRGGVHLRAYYFHLHATCTEFIDQSLEKKKDIRHIHGAGRKSFLVPNATAVSGVNVAMDGGLYEIESLAEHMEVTKATDAAARLDTVICARELVAPVRKASRVGKLTSGLQAKKRQREREAGRKMKRDCLGPDAYSCETKTYLKAADGA